MYSTTSWSASLWFFFFFSKHHQGCASKSLNPHASNTLTATTTKKEQTKKTQNKTVTKKNWRIKWISQNQYIPKHISCVQKSFRPVFKLQNWLKALDVVLANWNIQPVLLPHLTLSARVTLVILISPEKLKYDSRCKRWINALETELVISPYSPALNEDWAPIKQSDDIWNY